MHQIVFPLSLEAKVLVWKYDKSLGWGRLDEKYDNV